MLKGTLYSYTMNDSISILCKVNYLSFGFMQGSSARNWLKCAGRVAQCTSQCVEGISATACISCMGSSYDQCKGCFSLIEEVQKQGDSIQHG